NLGVLEPIGWTAKPFSAVEREYGITEKEMYGVYWGVKTFEYELRGRRFKVITDHKALLAIREKPYFDNDKVNRWVRKIQEFDFVIEYNEGNKMGVPDALSRLHEREMRKENEKGKILKKAKWEK